MGHRRLTAEAYKGVRTSVETAGGDVSHAGKQRQRRGEGIHPLVDPSGYGLIRRSLPRYTTRPDGLLELVNGIPMSVETLLDATGSMGGNVQLAFDVLPVTYGLLSGGQYAVLGRYDLQIINAIFGDVVDDVVLYRSQAEMDEKIAEQLTYMVPEKAGGDTTEDPDYGIFAGAYLTDAFITRYGLKSYHFTVTDAPCRERIDARNLKRVFGDTVFEAVKASGYSVSEGQLPSTREMVASLLERAHAFVLCVGGVADVVRHWSRIYGEDRVVVISNTGVMPFVQAAIIGLTEGTLDLESVGEYLKEGGCDSSNIRSIIRAIAGIPLRAQAILPNFEKIPAKGSVFTRKGDLFPGVGSIVQPPSVSDVGMGSSGDEGDMWL